ncbi:MAG TPA: hypothetical protein VHE57_07600 [Mycobacteriales bacterium]|nr:hypothetical protein [Mycobacteriales bacterium]
MALRRTCALFALLVVAACGSHHGSGDNSTTTGVTSEPKPNAECSEAPGNQICGPNGLPTDTPNPTLSASPTDTGTTSTPRHCRHHHRHKHCPRPTASATP